jgi:enoyl-CoA hydratase/carnithine racemase
LEVTMSSTASETYASSAFEDYKDRFETIKMERRDGILQMTLHTNGGPLMWGELPHRELPRAFYEISADRENLCVIMTGAGDAFIPGIDMDGVRFAMASNEAWYKQVFEGTKLLLNLLDIDVPVIAAVNGPVSVHSELPVLCDIVLASKNTVFQDAPHFWNGLVPGDGIAQVWQLILGPNRGRYFLITGQQLDAEEALQLGVVSEVLEQDELLDRAWEIAREIVKRSPLTIRYTKILCVSELRRLLQENTKLGLIVEGACLVDEKGQDMGLAVTTTGIDGTGFARRTK